MSRRTRRNHIQGEDGTCRHRGDRAVGRPAGRSRWRPRVARYFDTLCRCYLAERPNRRAHSALAMGAAHEVTPHEPASPHGVSLRLPFPAGYRRHGCAHRGIRYLWLRHMRKFTAGTLRRPQPFRGPRATLRLTGHGRDGPHQRSAPGCRVQARSRNQDRPR